MNTRSASYKELKQFIKEERAKSKEAKDFFGDYTHLTTEDLRAVVDDYIEEFELSNNTIESTNSTVNSNESYQIIELLEKALNLLKNNSNYSSQKELQDLHKKAMEIEFELENSQN